MKLKKKWLSQFKDISNIRQLWKRKIISAVASLVGLNQDTFK